MRKSCLVGGMVLICAVAHGAIQEVPTHQVSFPSNASYHAIAPTSDTAYEALLDLDAGVSNVQDQVTANAANIASNAANIASNAANIATNAADIAANAANIATNAADIAANLVDIVDLDARVTDLEDDISYVVPVGSIVPFAAATPPSGWLECDGSAVSRTTYSNLYSVISTGYGYGDNATTFNLPDLRGMFLRGWDHGAGNDPDAASRIAQATGGATGNTVGSEQEDEFESHTHEVTADDSPAGYSLNSGDHSPADDDTVQTGAAGGNETRPKNVYVMYIIKF
jgi:microcystin-dependent protein